MEWIETIPELKCESITEYIRARKLWCKVIIQALYDLNSSSYELKTSAMDFLQGKDGILDVLVKRCKLSKFLVKQALLNEKYSELIRYLEDV